MAGVEHEEDAHLSLKAYEKIKYLYWVIDYRPVPMYSLTAYIEAKRFDWYLSPWGEPTSYVLPLDAFWRRPTYQEAVFRQLAFVIHPEIFASQIQHHMDKRILMNHAKEASRENRNPSIL